MSLVFAFFAYLILAVYIILFVSGIKITWWAWASDVFATITWTWFVVRDIKKYREWKSGKSEM